VVELTPERAYTIELSGVDVSAHLPRR